MQKYPRPYMPVEGKTYTLFGASDTSSSYYQTISQLASRILERFNDLEFINRTIRDFSHRKRLLTKIAMNPENTAPISFILHLVTKQLSEYTEKADSHLKSLPILKMWDRRLSTTRLQYHLYMLEIELTNRLNSADFRKADKKIALLPYCLRDFQVECKAVPDGFDTKCKHCSKNCYQNYVSKLLADNEIEAYIWVGADLKKEAKSFIRIQKTLGILGIACIPELVAGMRKYRKYNIPVIGLPLDANRCIRWMGSFNENSVNLDMLEKLITE
jgi:hypothetical protein